MELNSFKVGDLVKVTKDYRITTKGSVGYIRSIEKKYDEAFSMIQIDFIHVPGFKNGTYDVYAKDVQKIKRKFVFLMDGYNLHPVMKNERVEDGERIIDVKNKKGTFVSMNMDSPKFINAFKYINKES